MQEELRCVLELHGHSLQQVVRSELQIVQEQLQELRQDVGSQLEAVLAALASSPPGTTEQVTMDPDVSEMVEQVVDLIGEWD